MEKLTTTCVTPECRASYAHVWKKHTDSYGNEKFSLAMIFPEDEDFTTIKKCIQNALINKYGPNKADWSKKAIKSIEELIMKGNDEHPDDEVYANTKFFGAKSDTAPVIVRPGAATVLEPITDPEDFYSGCYCRVSVNFYVPKKFDRVCCALNNIMFVRDGEPLANKSSAEDDFAEFVGNADTDDIDDLM